MIKKAFVINLDKRIDRKLAFEKNVRKHLDFQVERVSAEIVKEPINNTLKSKINPWNFKDKEATSLKSHGVIGCCLSHLKIYKEIVDNNCYSPNDWFLIFEDDCKLNLDLLADFKYFLKNFQNNMFDFYDKVEHGIIFLNKNSDDSPHLTKHISPTSITTEAYMITKECAEKLYQFNENNLGAIDAHIKQFFENNIIYKQWISSKKFFFQENTSSDIQGISKKQHVFVINLENRKDRLNTFLNNFKQHYSTDLYELIRFPAVNTKKMIRFPLEKFKNLSPGEIGCFLSHYFIWKMMIKYNMDDVIVHEDDAVFKEDFKEKLKDFENIKDNYSLLYLGGRNKDFLYNGDENVTANIIKYDKILSGHCHDRTTEAYIISKSLANILVSIVDESECISQPIDHFIIQNVLKNNMYIFSFMPVICFQTHLDSDIR